MRQLSHYGLRVWARWSRIGCVQCPDSEIDVESITQHQLALLCLLSDRIVVGRGRLSLPLYYFYFLVLVIHSSLRLVCFVVMVCCLTLWLARHVCGGDDVRAKHNCPGRVLAGGPALRCGPLPRPAALTPEPIHLGEASHPLHCIASHRGESTISCASAFPCPSIHIRYCTQLSAMEASRNNSDSRNAATSFLLSSR